MDDTIGILRQMLAGHAKNAELAEATGSNEAAWHRNHCRALQAAITSLESATGQTSDARDAELIRALRNQYVSERTFRFQCENGMDYENARAHAESAVNQFEASFIAARERHAAMRQEAGDD